MRTYDTCHSAEDFTLGYSNFITPDVVASWENHFRAQSIQLLASDALHHDLVYGTDSRHRLDFFPARGSRQVAAAAPTLFAIHGGLWFLFDRWMMHGLVAGMTSAGINVACPSYRLAPLHGLQTIVGDCRAALQRLFHDDCPVAIERDRVSVLGHSAAGQLAAILASETAPDGRRLRHLIGVSGFFEIEPFALTEFQPLVRFSTADYQRWNPMNCVHGGMPAALLITGAEESNWLHEMNQTYDRELRRAGVHSTLMDVPRESHFSVLHAVGDPASPLHHSVVTTLHA